MRLKNWEEQVLRVDGTAKRVAEIEDELRQAAGLRRYASGRACRSANLRADGRVAAEDRRDRKSRNVTIDVLDAYVSALGGRLEVSVVRAGRRTRLLGASTPATTTVARGDSAKSGSFNALNHGPRKRADSTDSAYEQPETGQVSGAKGARKTRTTALPR